MSTRGRTRGILVVVAGTFAAAGIGAAGGDSFTVRPESGSTPAVRYQSGNRHFERMRPIYDLMNRRAEELRREENSAAPDPRVVKDLKARLRALAAQL